MADIKQIIDDNIYQNGQQRITGIVMNSVLKAMVDDTDEKVDDLSQKSAEISNDESDADLNICDENRQVLVSFHDGHIETKYFDSEKSAQTEENGDNADLDIADEDGQVLVSFYDGHIKTKYFDSKDYGNGNFPYQYQGEPLRLKRNYFKVSKIANLYNDNQGYSHQGMAIYENYLLSCQNYGWGTLYNITKDGIKKIGSSFKTAVWGATNHANTVSFGIEKYNPADKLPVAYISQCYDGYVGNDKDVCYVNRINVDNQSATLVQTIVFNDVNHLCGYALTWVIDHDNKLLFGYANSINNSDPNNKHLIMAFRLPKLSAGSRVVLNESDALFKYYIEDYTDAFKFDGADYMVGQGMLINNGALFLPTGTDKANFPAILYVWDIYERRMLNVINLDPYIAEEMEDVALFEDSLIITTNGTGLYTPPLYKLSIK